MGVRGWKIVGERGTLLLMFTGDPLQGLGETELRASAQGLLKEITDRDAVIAGKDAEIAQRLAQIAHTDSEMLVKDRSFAQGVTEVGCAAHARRKFFDLHANTQSAVAEQALRFFGELYEVEREVQALETHERLRLRQEKARPPADSLHAWMLAQRLRATDGTGLARALDYSLKRWAALTRYIDDGQLPIDNNWVENQIRPIALGRSNWLFAGSLRAGQRAAAVMSLIQSAKLNRLDPHAYLKDVLQRLPTHKVRFVAELLPHRWQPLPSAH